MALAPGSTQTRTSPAEIRSPAPAATGPQAASELGWVAAGATDPILGELIDGKYRVQERLGVGGMGVVYRVEHERMAKQFALKMLQPQFGKEREFYKRFVREARAASSIDHPHVVRVIDIGETHGALYYVMDLFRGAELRAVLDLAGPLPWRRVRTLAMQILEAAGAAHAQGFVHRDLKPDNIFLVGGHRSDHAMVFDFGIAHALKTDLNGTSLTAVGTVMGSPRYMSPEQCKGHKSDPRSDLYAVGVMIFECLTGRAPFEHDRIYDTIHAQVHEAAPSLESVSPGLRVPEGVQALLDRALQKDPDARYACAEDFYEAIKAVDGEEPRPTRPASRPFEAIERGRFRVWSFAAGVAVGGCLFALASVFR